MSEPLIIARAGETDLGLLLPMGNRHGLITGATGTGKTVTLEKIAQMFSQQGVPVFMADVKGDLYGISQPGTFTERLQARFKQLNLPEPQWAGCPTTLWDVYGEKGHPVRATVSDMGPLMLSRMLDLNDTQTGVLTLVFKIADDNGMLLLDAKDLRAMLQFVGDQSGSFTTEYGNISAASIGAIQRSLIGLEEQGGDQFFGEPMLNIDDLMQTVKGQGVINILAADKLINAPQLYATFLLWLLSELFEHLPEVGDLDKPKLVFFFDEAHLLFSDAPKTLLAKVEQVVRLIRSKGVGVYFVTQNPVDVPDIILGQLGNRVQHALRAFSPRDQKAVKVAAETMRANPALDIETIIGELGVGEALVSFLDEKGRPNITERAFIIPPSSRIGPIIESERNTLLANSLVAGVYEKTIDRDSAYEKIKGRTIARQGDVVSSNAGGNGTLTGDEGFGHSGGAGSTSVEQSTSPTSAPQPAPAEQSMGSKVLDGVKDVLGDLTHSTGRKDSMLDAAAKSAARAIGSQVGRAVIRGVLGSILGGRK